MIFHETCWTLSAPCSSVSGHEETQWCSHCCHWTQWRRGSFSTAQKKLTSLASFRERNILKLYACRKDYGFIFASRPASWDADTPNTESWGRLIRPICIFLDEQNCYSPIRTSSIKTWIFSSAFCWASKQLTLFLVGVWIQSLKGFMGICQLLICVLFIYLFICWMWSQPGLEMPPTSPDERSPIIKVEFGQWGRGWYILHLIFSPWLGSPIRNHMKGWAAMSQNSGNPKTSSRHGIKAARFFSNNPHGENISFSWNLQFLFSQNAAGYQSVPYLTKPARFV